MPYIPQNDRLYINQHEVTTEGQLNYYIARLIGQYLYSKGGVTYKNINAVIGALECNKLEVYRRLAAPYEDKKKEENGDVF